MSTSEKLGRQILQIDEVTTGASLSMDTTKRVITVQDPPPQCCCTPNTESEGTQRAGPRRFHRWATLSRARGPPTRHSARLSLVRGDLQTRRTAPHYGLVEDEVPRIPGPYQAVNPSPRFEIITLFSPSHRMSSLSKKTECRLRRLSTLYRTSGQVPTGCRCRKRRPSMMSRTVLEIAEQPQASPSATNTRADVLAWGSYATTGQRNHKQPTSSRLMPTMPDKASKEVTTATGAAVARPRAGLSFHPRDVVQQDNGSRMAPSTGRATLEGAATTTCCTHSPWQISTTTVATLTKGRHYRSTTHPAADASSPCRPSSPATATTTEATRLARVADLPPPAPVVEKACATVMQPLRHHGAAPEGEPRHHGAGLPLEGRQARRRSQPSQPQLAAYCRHRVTMPSLKHEGRTPPTPPTRPWPAGPRAPLRRPRMTPPIEEGSRGGGMWCVVTRVTRIRIVTAPASFIRVLQADSPPHDLTSQIWVGDTLTRRNHPAATILACLQASEEMLRRRRGLGKGKSAGGGGEEESDAGAHRKISVAAAMDPCTIVHRTPCTATAKFIAFPRF
nr:unnamed protein product [Digitaria exilis]